MLIEAYNLHKIYNRSTLRLHVLKDISLKIREGDTLAVVGPSGAGKSTLLHILSGLDHPSEGTVIFDGQDIGRINDQQRAHLRNGKIGFVFQFYHLLPEFTALENVLLPAMVRTNVKTTKDLKDKGMDLLGKVGLKERAYHRPGELSGGEQQRVAIARSLINDPKIIFCDEPTGNLDSKNGEMIVQLLLDLNKKNKQTLVIVTHDESIARLSRTVVHLCDGALTGGYSATQNQ